MDNENTTLYNLYSQYKSYQTPKLKKKAIDRYERMIWDAASCEQGMRFLEIGCGTGEFLLFLYEKGVENFIGIDSDKNLYDILDEKIRSNFICCDAISFLDCMESERFDRIVSIDVLEHFSVSDSIHLLTCIGNNLTERGKLILRVPNMSSPWGLQYQHGDLTHRTAFTPHSIRQIAMASGMCVENITPVLQGTRRRMMTEKMFHRFLSWILVSPLEIWTPNFVAVLKKA